MYICFLLISGIAKCSNQSRRVFIHLYSSGNFPHKSHDQQNLLLHKRGLLRSSRVLDWSTCPLGGGFARSPSRTGEDYFTKMHIWLYACKNSVYITYICIYVQFDTTLRIRPHMQRHAYKMQTLTYQVLHTICAPSETLLRDPFICRDLWKSDVKRCQMCIGRGKWPAVLPEKYQPPSTSKNRCTYKAILISVSSMLIFEVEISMECLPSKLADGTSHYCKCMQVLI